MTYGDCLELLEVYRMAVRLESNLSDHAGLRPMAKDIREGLEGAIAKLLSEQGLMPYPAIPNIPIVPDPYKGWTWTSGKPVDVTPKVTWTTSGAGEAQ